MTNAQIIAQRRAKAALDQIFEVQKANGATRKAYVSYLKGLPATIISIGLGQTVAMLLARGAEDGKGDRHAEAYRLLAKHLETWLCVGWREGPYCTQVPVNDRHGLGLMKQIVALDQTAYTLGRAEALAYLDWLKRLGVGLLEKS